MIKNNPNTARRDTLALILAGGKGSRLCQLTDSQSKPAVFFGGKFRIIDFPLSNCVNSGIRQIGVLTQYKAHTLIRHIQQGWGFLQPGLDEFVELWPAQQQTQAESWYQGTADAVYQNIATIREHNPKYILLLAGDHIYKQDYSIMLQEHIRRGADATVCCLEVPRKTAANRFGIATVDDSDRVVDFVEKPADPSGIPGRPDQAFASMGLYVFNTDFLLNLLVSDAAMENSSHDFGKDLLPRMAREGAALYAHRFGESCVGASTEPYWRDVGTIDSYWSANLDLTSFVPDLDMYDQSWPIWTFQEQLPGAKFVFETAERTGGAFQSVIGSGCIISGSIVRRSLLFSNVHVHSYCLIEDTVVSPDCIIGQYAKIYKAVLAPGCVIPRGLVIGQDTELDRKRFNVSEGGVVLVTPEMLAALPADKLLTDAMVQPTPAAPQA
ncbi:glucose-1-phosphate adenylyltransferase [Alphaproteobacteria bacterium]|nr:glucose-1-phosphate adenylyltransferase [Alphaproteobacteria bacterium]